MAILLQNAGLGNQLFMIFTSLSHALKKNKPLVIYDPYKRPKHRPAYWDTFLRQLQPFVSFSLPDKEPFQESHFSEFRDIPTEVEVISGYFQNHRYFEDHAYAITDFIGIREMQRALHLNLQPRNTSMHFRLGDYQTASRIGLDYYLRALTTLVSLKPISYVYFVYELADYKQVYMWIKSLHQHFPQITFLELDQTLNDYQTLLAMSRCENNIISNSTFSWWGAYFNDFTDKTVITPKFLADDASPSTWITV